MERVFGSGRDEFVVLKRGRVAVGSWSSTEIRELQMTVTAYPVVSGLPGEISGELTVDFDEEAATSLELEPRDGHPLSFAYARIPFELTPPLVVRLSWVYTSGWSSKGEPKEWWFLVLPIERVELPEELEFLLQGMGVEIRPEDKPLLRRAWVAGQKVAEAFQELQETMEELLDLYPELVNGFAGVMRGDLS